MCDAITVTREGQNVRMMNHAIDECRLQSRVCENAIQLTEF